jgi:hypothetical protein
MGRIARTVAAASRSIARLPSLLTGFPPGACKSLDFHVCSAVFKGLSSDQDRLFHSEIGVQGQDLCQSASSKEVARVGVLKDGHICSQRLDALLTGRMSQLGSLSNAEQA